MIFWRDNLEITEFHLSLLLVFYLVALVTSSFGRFSMVFTGFYWVLMRLTKTIQGLTGFDWVLLGFTRFYWVLLGFTGFCWVLLGFTELILGFIRFY